MIAHPSVSMLEGTGIRSAAVELQRACRREIGSLPIASKPIDFQQLHRFQAKTTGGGVALFQQHTADELLPKFNTAFATHHRAGSHCNCRLRTLMGL